MMQRIEINRNILEMEYAVRGPIAQHAQKLRKLGRDVVMCNIGNPQALGQVPMSYLRQVLSMVENPQLISRERQIKRMFEVSPVSEIREQDFLGEEVLELSENILKLSRTGTGAYTQSKGFEFVRKAIAKFINQRDGFQENSDLASNEENIFLTNGASQGATFLIDLLISKKSDGIMIPIPQYPLYSATIKKAGGTQIDYYPDEDKGWIFDKTVLERAYQEAVSAGINPKAIVVINPANPTGAILGRECIEEIVDFALEHGLVIIADEVYQENTYNGEFISFAQVVGAKPVSLVSLHSISKGFYGECGHRGGYLEIRNPPEVEGHNGNLLDVLNKLASVSLCSNTSGQILTYLMVHQPKEGSQVAARFNEEKNRILGELYKKAEMIRESFNEMDSMECFGETGAMYLFPRINHLPEGKTDFDYCMALLDETGLCTVNGSGFGQREGTHHLRIAFLPPKEKLEEILPKWVEFHNRYVKR